MAQSAAITNQIVIATNATVVSLLPTDLNTTNNVLSNVIGALEDGLSSGVEAPDEVHFSRGLFTVGNVTLNSEYCNITSSEICAWTVLYAHVLKVCITLELCNDAIFWVPATA